MGGIEHPAFLRLLLLSIDDSDGAIRSWRGLVGAKRPIRVDMTLHYDARISALSEGAPVAVELENGETRRCILLSVEPAPHAVTTALVVFPLAADTPVASFSHTIEIAVGASEQLAADIERLHQYFQVSSDANLVLHGTNTDVRFIPN